MFAILALPSALASLGNDIIPEKDNKMLRGADALATKVKKNFHQAHYDSALLNYPPGDFIQTFQQTGGTKAECESFAKDTMTSVRDGTI